MNNIGISQTLTYKIVGTGQTNSYNNTGIITQPSSGQSFYGQNAVEGTLSKSNIFKKSITCPELWLWMLEAAIDDSNITKDDVKALYTQACKYKNKLITKKEWQAFFSSYWSKLIDAITT